MRGARAFVLAIAGGAVGALAGVSAHTGLRLWLGEPWQASYLVAPHAQTLPPASALPQGVRLAGDPRTGLLLVEARGPSADAATALGAAAALAVASGSASSSIGPLDPHAAAPVPATTGSLPSFSTESARLRAELASAEITIAALDGRGDARALASAPDLPEPLGALASAFREIDMRFADVEADLGPRHPAYIEVARRRELVGRQLVDAAETGLAQARATQERAQAALAAIEAASAVRAPSEGDGVAPSDPMPAGTSPAEIPLAARSAPRHLGTALAYPAATMPQAAGLGALAGSLAFLLAGMASAPAGTRRRPADESTEARAPAASPAVASGVPAEQAQADERALLHAESSEPEPEPEEPETSEDESDPGLSPQALEALLTRTAEAIVAHDIDRVVALGDEAGERSLGPLLAVALADLERRVLLVDATPDAYLFEEASGEPARALTVSPVLPLDEDGFIAAVRLRYLVDPACDPWRTEEAACLLALARASFDTIVVMAPSDWRSDALEPSAEETGRAGLLVLDPEGRAVAHAGSAARIDDPDTTDPRSAEAIARNRRAV
ncbi:hypothetical protein [Salinarimonas ramus]|uniref:Uncharacterized protein n=1 Tax=Salinarimonas ramus TaxID=690164 RepID=A0A917Q8C1_9HYPH|nr:hypothetical protein [Salinarimonas ramus]GGK34053.1 hypothetical protein GCM10011322_20920 [Salinarimonas ramus]